MMPPREGPPMERRGHRWSRRGFVVGASVGLGLLAGCGRLPWQAQPKIYRIGFLSGTFSASSAEFEAFRQGLRALGYVEGQNTLLESRFAENDDQLPALAADLVRLQVDVIVGSGTPANQAAKEATGTIPIVIASSGDPVKSGLVASYARPGGNLTGFSSLSQGLSGKRLQLLTETVPGTSRVAVLGNPINPVVALTLSEMPAAAHALAVRLQVLEVQGPDDFEGAFEAAGRERAEALVTELDALTSAHRTRIVDLAAKSGLPAIYPERGFVEVGGLMAYAVSFPALYRRAAGSVDKILNGAQPADLPVEQPMTFDFVVNLKTAQALGITFPNEIMLQVTEVIQ
jgi:putative tryptophan/tyrosine transport system substrate-binding protein